MTLGNIQINCLGSPNIEGIKNTFNPDSNKKAFLLLNYLKATGRTLTRSRVNSLFWPDIDGNDNLNRELSLLRKSFGAQIFSAVKSPRLALAQDCNLIFDTDQVNQLLKSTSTVDLLQAASLFKGEYLESLTPDNDQIDNWLDSERELWRLKGVLLLERLIQRKVVHQSIEELAYTLIELDNFDEDVFYNLLIYLGRNQRVKEAKLLFQKHQFIYAKDLYQEPSNRMTDLFRRIESSSLRPKVENARLEEANFIGRELEIDYLAERLSSKDCRLITLKGIGGIGKTLLAQKLAQHLSRTFLDGICYIELENIQSVQGIYTALSDSLGIALKGSEDPLLTIIKHIRNQEILFIFDNFDHLIPQAKFVRRLLHGGSQIKCLVTSREILALSDEEIVLVEGLPYPIGLTSIDRDITKAVDRFASVALFAQRVAKVQQTPALSTANLSIITQICQNLQGSPLAIELAAACVRHESYQEILDGILGGLGYLENKLISHIDRHSGLRAVFDYSWELLNSDEKEVLAAVSIFVGGFDKEAFQQVVPNHRSSILNRLVDKSLLQKNRETGRLSFHPAIHEFANEKMAQYEAQDFKKAYFHYYLNYIVQRNGIFGDQDRILQEIEQNLGNIHATWFQMLAEEDITLLKPIGFSMMAYYELRGKFRAGFDVFQQAQTLLQARPKSKTSPLSLHLFKIWLGDLTYRLGLHRKALKLLSEAQQFFEVEIDDCSQDDCLVFINYCLSITYTYVGDYEKSILIGKQALNLIKDSTNTQLSPVFAEIGLGLALMMCGRLNEAKGYLLESVIHSEIIGDLRGKGSAYVILSQIERLKGNLGQAQIYSELAFAIVQNSQDMFLRGIYYHTQGEIQFHLGNFIEAKEDFELAIKYSTDAKEIWVMQRSQLWLAYCLVQLKEVELAKGYLRQSLEFHQDDLGRMAYLRTIFITSETLFAQGEDEQAQRLFDFSLTHPSFPYDFRRVVELGPRANQASRAQVLECPVHELDDELAEYIKYVHHSI